MSSEIYEFPYLFLQMAKSGCAKKSDGIEWVAGHYWACEPCASALKAVGVKEIRVKEFE